MDKLSKAREIISETDKEIAELFEKRMEAVRIVAEYKKEKGLPISDPAREEELLKNNLQYIKDEETAELYAPFFKETLKLSKALQRSVIGGDEALMKALSHDKKARVKP